jgi:pyridoxal phosphate enzyme (YggS family)
MIRQQYLRVLDRVAEAAVKAGRSMEDVRLMAVTKTVAEPEIRQAVEAGAALLGENKVQELCAKRELFVRSEMHLIGHLQSNKAAKAAAAADMIQSLDSVRIAGEISRAAEKLGKVLPVLLEVNIGRDPAKFGFLPEALEEALDEIAAFRGVSVQGLMTIPPFLEEKTRTQEFFSRMHQLFIDIRGKKMDNISMSVLSMGMSDDFELAVMEGSTLVRVGSAIFGDRNYR